MKMLRLFPPQFLMVLMLLAATLSASAQESQFPSYVGHVNDFANVIDAQTKQQLETILNNFENLTGTQIAVATVQSLNGRPIEDYANDLYRSWGIGAKTGPNKDKGALLLVSIEDRRTRLEVGYGLEGDLPDGLAGEIIRRMRPFFQRQDYSGGINVGVRTLVDTLAQKWNVSIEGIEDRRYAYTEPAPSERQTRRGAPLMLILFIIFIVIFLIVARASRRGGGRGGRGGRGMGPGDLWWLYPIIFNRSGGSFGGGSWGGDGGWGGGRGGGGGGGWGGFGGGSSGGGGASDSW